MIERDNANSNHVFSQNIAAFIQANRKSERVDASDTLPIQLLRQKRRSAFS